MKPMGQLVSVCDISKCRRDEMFSLMQDYYEHVTRNAFDADLDDKQWVIQIIDEVTDQVLGFSTQKLLHLEVERRPIKALFSGDTIIKRDSWGQQHLFQVSGWFVRSLMDDYPSDELYWFLISKGYKTYRFLPLFFHEFYPRYDTATPSRQAAVIDALGRYKFSDSYDGLAGIVRAGADSCRLRQGVADITAERLLDPHIQFFAERNPGHALGDELCCIAPLRTSNLTRVAYRAMGSKPPVQTALS